MSSLGAVQISKCWRDGRVTMLHRSVGAVDVDLDCGSEPCLCARSLGETVPDL